MNAKPRPKWPGLCDNCLSGILLEELLDLVPHPEEDNGANYCADDLSIPLRPEGSARTEQAEQPAAHESAEKTDDDVPDETALLLDNKESGKPACDSSKEQCENDVHGVRC